jgi:flagellar motor switch protein FliM
MSHTAAHLEAPEGLFSGPQDLLERLPMLRTVLQKTATHWADNVRSISASVPTACLLGVEGGPAERIIAGTSNHSVACVLEATEWNGRLIVSADQAFVVGVVETLLGGDGSEPPPAADRALTRVDFKLAQMVIEQFANALAAAFESVKPTSFAVGPAAARVNFEVLGRMTVPLVAAKFRLSVLGLGGDLTLMMSQSLLSPMRNELSRVTPPEAAMPDPAWSQKIHSEVTRTNVELIAVLDEQMLPLAEVARFAVGQMLQLRATPEGPVLVECNGERLINCQIGKANGAYALRVHEFIDQEQEFMEDILPAGLE